MSYDPTETAEEFINTLGSTHSIEPSTLWLDVLSMAVSNLTSHDEDEINPSVGLRFRTMVFAVRDDRTELFDQTIDVFIESNDDVIGVTTDEWRSYK